MNNQPAHKAGIQRRFVFLKLKFVLVSLITIHVAFAESIDIGIFESTTNSDQIDIRIRPDFNIAENQTITAILYTVRWDEPSVEISTQYIYPFFVSPQGTAIQFNDHYYQLFAAVPMISIAMNANSEYTVSSFTFTNGDCANFEIIEDDWTQGHNGNVYLEFLGEDVTGIIYEPIVEFGSNGGIVTGGGTIQAGESTGNLLLSGQNGFVNFWQKRLDGDSWTIIDATAGLVTYNEVPSTTGVWEYRCAVQNDDCPEAYSQIAQVVVIDSIATTIITESINDVIEISCYGNSIYLINQGSERVEGELVVINLLGQKIFSKHISTLEFCQIDVKLSGIVLIIFKEELSGRVFTEKTMIND
jgi:hypothetical protein